MTMTISRAAMDALLAECTGHEGTRDGAHGIVAILHRCTILDPVADQAAVGSIESAIFAEIDRAVSKFPTWPTDPLHAIAVLGEEFGELTKAVLQSVYEPHKSTPEDVASEAVQTAAMAIRFCRSLERYAYSKCEQHEQARSALRSTPSAAPQEYEPKNLFAPGQIVKHRKGGIYEILFRCTIEKDLSDCYAYRSKEGRVWIRPAREMEDGRFTFVAQADNPSAAASAEAQPSGYHYVYGDPLSGNDVIVTGSSGGEWNGQKPRRAVPYYYAPQSTPALREVTDEDVEAACEAYRNSPIYSISSGVRAALESFRARLSTAQGMPGWKLVPTTATPDMVGAGSKAARHSDIDGYRLLAIYRAMIAAAPEAP